MGYDRRKNIHIYTENASVIQLPPGVAYRRITACKKRRKIDEATQDISTQEKVKVREHDTVQ